MSVCLTRLSRLLVHRLQTDSFLQMKALTLLIALIGVVTAEVFLDERFSDGGKKKIQNFILFS